MESSPLLRLPAELRAEIWAFAYSNIVIDVHHYPPNVSAQSPAGLAYSVCTEWTGKTCQIACPWHGDQQPSLEWRSIYYSDLSKNVCLHPFRHPLVNKQFWAETRHVILATGTWVFRDRYDMRDLLRSGQTWVPQIRRIAIRDEARILMRDGAGSYSSTLDLVHFCNKWKEALTWRLIRALESLESVELSVSVRRISYHDSGPLHLDKDILKHANCIKAGLPAIIRAFQQHRLDPKKTVVRFSSDNLSTSRPNVESLEEAQLLSDVMRELLLIHVPLGQGVIAREERRMLRCENARRNLPALQE